MAIRPIFLPAKNGGVRATDCLVEFDWSPGMAVSQKQKSVRSLHAAAELIGISPVLEISSKSPTPLGNELSAFNLSVTTKLSNCTFTVETAFQGSKIFEKGGPFRDLVGLDSRAAKRDIRLKESGNLIGFDFFGRRFPIKPRTFFYDWLYINALALKKDWAIEVTSYDGFSDIEFNPSKSINCQARSAALFVSLATNDLLARAIESPEKFLETMRDHYAAQTDTYVQATMV